MKRILILITAVIPLLTACASSNNVIADDAYYSPFDNNAQHEKTLVTANYSYSEPSYVEYTPIDTIIVDESPSTNVTVAIGAGVGIGWGLYTWDPFWDPYWYPAYTPYYYSPYYYNPYYYNPYPYYWYDWHYPQPCAN